MSRIKAAVLSAGAWSRSSHLPALVGEDDVDVVAVSSPDAETAEKLAGLFHVPRWTTDWRDALAEGADLVVVSSPPVAHEEMVIGALEAGAHVLVEKPFALATASAVRMRDAAIAAGKHLLVGFGWPAAPIFARAHAQVEAGEIGSIEHMTFHLAVNTRALLCGGTDGGWGGGAASKSATYTDPRISAGGSVAVSMSHQLGLTEWLTGDEIVAVQASTFPAGARIDLHATVNAEFAGGGSAAISCASTHPYLARPQWHMALYGGKGQIWLDSMADHLRLVRANGEMVTFKERDASGEYDAGAPTKALIACARGVAAPASLDARLATRVVTITDAIYQSARSGAKLRIETP
ncbi:Gfo/Idh/MocA family oxidoreductase [Devosia rhodophyticola]|uniref:Gfo/Idh/MocA family oxidoreductase n=1 Tax=Devosia rhodophyticola TaxID=3026423 RepID=A0ABY7YTP4_9HYPH|nr:Gfo/Idh/MocA family oxidoreductase [Devosia rhodophyticola]WDR04743.1 Gfo/Idh/MocA family oxidoreductase [Devosia rhodophyticola]